MFFDFMGMGCNYFLHSHSNGIVHFFLGHGMKFNSFRTDFFEHFDLSSLLVVVIP